MIKVYGFFTYIFDREFVNSEDAEQILNKFKKEGLGIHPQFDGLNFVFEKKETAEKYRNIFVEKFSKYMNIDAVEEGTMSQEEFEASKLAQKEPIPKYDCVYMVSIYDMPVNTHKDKIYKFFDGEKENILALASTNKINQADVVFETPEKAKDFKNKMKRKFKELVKIEGVKIVKIPTKKLEELKKEC